MTQKTKTFSVRAVEIQKTLGTRKAAAYLRNRNVSIEKALQVLTGRGAA